MIEANVGVDKALSEQALWTVHTARPRPRQTFIIFLYRLPFFLVLTAWLYVSCSGFGFFLHWPSTSLVVLKDLHVIWATLFSRRCTSLEPGDLGWFFAGFEAFDSTDFSFVLGLWGLPSIRLKIGMTSSLLSHSACFLFRNTAQSLWLSSWLA